MKIRSLTDLQTVLDTDFIWRRKELTTALFSVRKTNGKTVDFAIRSAIPLLYAHWEGYVKNSASYYIEYVSFQSLPINDLANCFVATALKNKISSFGITLKATQQLAFVNYLDSCGAEVPKFNPEHIIKTGSNLNSVILEEILTVIGISYLPYELKANLIDEQLLNYRNTIAHGEWLTIDKDGYEILHKEVYGMLTTIKTAIENAAVLKSFRK